MLTQYSDASRFQIYELKAEPRYKGWLDLPCYCLCFEPVKARHQKPALMVRSHAGLPGWLTPTRLIGFEEYGQHFFYSNGAL